MTKHIKIDCDTMGYQAVCDRIIDAVVLAEDYNNKYCKGKKVSIFDVLKKLSYEKEDYETLVDLIELELKRGDV